MELANMLDPEFGAKYKTQLNESKVSSVLSIIDQHSVQASLWVDMWRAHFGKDATVQQIVTILEQFGDTEESISILRKECEQSDFDVEEENRAIRNLIQRLSSAGDNICIFVFIIPFMYLSFRSWPQVGWYAWQQIWRPIQEPAEWDKGEYPLISHDNPWPQACLWAEMWRDCFGESTSIEKMITVLEQHVDSPPVDVISFLRNAHTDPTTETSRPQVNIVIQST